MSKLEVVIFPSHNYILISNRNDMLGVIIVLEFAYLHVCTQIVFDVLDKMCFAFGFFIYCEDIGILVKSFM